MRLAGRQRKSMVKIALSGVLLGGMALAQGGPKNVQQRPAILNEPTDTLRVNLGSAGVQANGPSDVAAVSSNGRFVVYSSPSTNLVPGDAAGIRDVFLFDAATKLTVIVSVEPSGQPGNGASGTSLDVSDDGRYVAFDSWANDLVAGDTNGQLDIFVRDVFLGITERVSVDSNGLQANASSAGVTLSADGRFVAYSSWATNLVGTDINDQQDIFLHDRQTGETRRLTETSTGAGGAGVGGEGTSHSPTISSDGRFVAYSSRANNLVDEPLSFYHYIFVNDTLTGETWHASKNSFGEHAHDHSNTKPGITPDGRFVVFGSEAYNLAFPDLNFASDVFLHDRQTGDTTRISEGWLGQEGNGGSILPSISDDGRFITFVSSASNLVPGDTNGQDDVFLYDRVLSTMRCISDDALGGTANGPSQSVTLSADGRNLLFVSEASDLVFADTNRQPDVFLRPVR